MRKSSSHACCKWPWCREWGKQYNQERSQGKQQRVPPRVTHGQEGALGCRTEVSTPLSPCASALAVPPSQHCHIAGLEVFPTSCSPFFHFAHDHHCMQRLWKVTAICCLRRAYFCIKCAGFQDVFWKWVSSVYRGNLWSFSVRVTLHTSPGAFQQILLWAHQTKQYLPSSVLGFCVPGLVARIRRYRCHSSELPELPSFPRKGEKFHWFHC